MATTRRGLDVGTEHARQTLLTVGRELREARMDRGLSTRTVGRAAAMSAASVSRIERGRFANASLLDLARLHAVVGLKLSIRSYPDGEPVRDRAHVALLEAFRAELHPSFVWRAEVPIGMRDLRAWDATVRIPGAGVYGVEAETSPRDVQALLRRLNRKREDGRVRGILLVLPSTRQVRTFLDVGRELLRPEFPADGRSALVLLRAGRDPGGSAVIVLPGAFLRPSRTTGTARTARPTGTAHPARTTGTTGTARTARPTGTAHPARTTGTAP